MLFRSIATRDENCSVRLKKGDRPFVETRATLLQSFRRA